VPAVLGPVSLSPLSRAVSQVRDLRGTRLQGDHRKGRRRRGRITRVKRRGALAPKRERAARWNPSLLLPQGKNPPNHQHNFWYRTPYSCHVLLLVYRVSRQPVPVGLRPIYGRRVTLFTVTIHSSFPTRDASRRPIVYQHHGTKSPGRSHVHHNPHQHQPTIAPSSCSPSAT
jgi:hypothetical protein